MFYGIKYSSILYCNYAEILGIIRTGAGAFFVEKSFEAITYQSCWASKKIIRYLWYQRS